MSEEEIQRYVRNLKTMKAILILVALFVAAILGIQAHDYLNSPQLDQLILQ
jgi:hypothetical protein